MPQYNIKKCYQVFSGEPDGEPMDVMSEDQLFAWLNCRGFAEASKIINEVDYKKLVTIELQQT